jgi:hypothetical protein
MQTKNENAAAVITGHCQLTNIYMTCELEQLIDKVAELHLADYRDELKHCLLPDMARIVQSYCLDEMEFENELYTEIYRVYASTISTRPIFTRFITVPDGEHILVENPKARQWAATVFCICHGHMCNYYRDHRFPPHQSWQRVADPSRHRFTAECYVPAVFGVSLPNAVAVDP